LTQLGARVEPLPFPDHHAFTASDITMIAQRSDGFDYVVCTLKDAVKLRPVWPAGSAPLWYVSQAVSVERGEATIDELLMRLRGRIPVN
jgi:tetraacyldisaccharide 4'-kinase